jgi:hypothetical protein
MRGEGDRRCDRSPAEVGHLPAGADAAVVVGARLWGVAQPRRAGGAVDDQLGKPVGVGVSHAFRPSVQLSFCLASSASGVPLRGMVAEKAGRYSGRRWRPDGTRRARARP